ncbi:bifunctional THO complex subunit 2 [Babesia duncani]|uniref:THO complex subunit 2 n=1 Tax=Babesia duncani TaxID=323732 RepID=A0AAD9PMV0_9APIC|nr:bifunctional THO complex subunit 2 [Babesia duncani]
MSRGTGTSARWEKNSRPQVSKRSREEADGRDTFGNSAEDDVRNEKFTPQQIEKVKQLLEFNVDSDNASALFTLAKSVAHGRVSPILAADFLRTKFISLSAHSWQIYRILDVLAFMLEDVQTHENIRIFLESMQRFGLASFREIVSAIDAAKLDACGYSNGLATLAVRERTRDLYMLKVFSLYRECSVGFHLVNRVLYSHQYCSDLTIENIKAIKRQIKRICGIYGLCATRILYDIICWLGEVGASSACIYEMLRDWPDSRIYEIIQMILSHARAQIEAFTPEERFWKVDTTTSRRIYNVIAALHVQGRVNILDLYRHLDCLDSNLARLADGFFEAAAKRPVTLTRTWKDQPPIAISRAMASACPISNDKSGYVWGSRALDSNCIAYAKTCVETRMQALAEHCDYKNEDSGAIDFIILADDPFGWVRDQAFALECGKFLLLGAMLDLVNVEAPEKSWTLCQHMLLHIEQRAQFPPFTNGNVCRALCRLISRLIDRLLQISACEQFLNDVLKWVGCGLYIDPIVLGQLLRYLDGLVDSDPDHLEKVILEHVFPAICMCTEGNVQITELLWSILAKFPVSRRYRIYQNFWVKVSSDHWTEIRDSTLKATHASCRWAHLATLFKARFIFKRVTSNMLKSTKTAAVRGTVSLVTGIAAVNPLAVAECILSQCEMFENLVAPLAEVTKYFTKFACDVFYFVLVSNSLNIDWNRDARRLHANAQLAAKFFKRHFATTLEPLLISVIQQVTAATSRGDSGTMRLWNIGHQDMDDGVESTELVLEIEREEFGQQWMAFDYIVKLIECAGGVAQLAEAHALTNDQIFAQAGGPLLKSEIMATEPDEDYCSMNSRDALSKVLSRPLFRWSILSLCGKLKHELLYDCMQFDARTVYSSADYLHRVAWHLGEFIEAARGFEDSNWSLEQFWDPATAMGLNCPSNRDFCSDCLSPDFYHTVSRLRLRDIWIPRDQYAKAINRLVSWTTTASTATTSTKSSSTSYRRQRRLKQRLQNLQKELEALEISTSESLQRLIKVAKQWLVPSCQIGPNITIAFVEHIIAPRILVSESEALFCAKLVDIMLENKVEFFNFFDLVNCWTRMLIPIVGSCTQREAPLLAIFTNHQFAMIKMWSRDGQEFENMTRDHPCFCITFKFAPNKTLTRELLIKGIHKWEGRILRALSFQLGLSLGKADSTESPSPTFVGQKAAIVFLARCHESFPISAAAAKVLLSGLVKVAAETQDTAKDIALAANTLIKTYQRYEKEGAWIN